MGTRYIYILKYLSKTFKMIYHSLGSRGYITRGLLVSKVPQGLGLGSCMEYRNDREVDYYLNIKFGGPRTSPWGPRPNFVPLGPRALSVVSFDSGCLVVSNDISLQGVILKSSKKQTYPRIFSSYQICPYMYYSNKI